MRYINNLSDGNLPMIQNRLMVPGHSDCRDPVMLGEPYLGVLCGAVVRVRDFRLTGCWFEHCLAAPFGIPVSVRLTAVPNASMSHTITMYCGKYRKPYFSKSGVVRFLPSNCVDSITTITIEMTVAVN